MLRTIRSARDALRGKLFGKQPGTSEVFRTQIATHKELAKIGAKSGYPVADYLFECLNPSSTAHLFEEIFLYEPYAFETRNSTPQIIDCGTNIGLGIAYFKWRYPNSNVLGFEPHPAAAAVAKRNCTSNSLDGVTIEQSAIAKDDGIAMLNFVDDEIMASTLSKRLAARNLGADQVEVKVRSLNRYVNGEVDFLKLDIEGAEADALISLGDKVRLIRNMFIEYHYTQGDLASNSLASIIAILEANGFHYLIRPALAFARGNDFQPLLSLKSRRIYSLSIYATQISGQ